MSSTDVDGEILGKRLVKRRKTSVSDPTTSSIPKHRGSRKNDGRLKVMLDMPLDILYEVFSHLTPADLIHLARTSKSLRLLLLSRRSSFIWRSVRTQVPGPTVPNPPEDMSEPSWANLIFGGPFCSNCGKRGVNRIDFALRRRLCQACVAEGLVTFQKIPTKLWGLFPVVPDMVPYTNSSRCGDRTIGKRYYWIQDLYNMHMRLEEWNSSNLTQEIICKYYDEEVRISREIVAGAQEFEEWTKDVSRWRITNANTMRLARRNEINQRCLAMGFDRSDLDSFAFSMLPGVRSEKPLTKKAWSLMQLRLTSWLTDRMRSRVKNCRSEKVQAIFNSLVGSLIPSQHCYLPSKNLSRYKLEALPCFQPLMQKDPREDIPDSVWVEAAHRHLEEAATSMRDKFIAMLPPGNYEAALPLKFISMYASTMELQAARKGLGNFAGPLELAISVFISDVNGRRNILIGRDLCNAWTSIIGFELTTDLYLKFYPRGSNIAATLVTLAGMDPEKTTTSAMDQRILFFRCNECSSDTDGNWVHSWRYWVLATPVHNHAPSQLEFVDRTKNDIALYEENTDAMDCFEGECACCNHCNHSENRSDAIWAIFQHLRSVHDLASEDVVEDEDFFRRPQPGFPQRPRLAGRIQSQTWSTGGCPAHETNPCI
ncbi:hypothetical protein DENSPDRAFT_831972 [Dentipellis sp. KUC8613]|nr:hypothetical protein DENSPDRAFT_831972 [Dentipellis sp. KUC8613]